MTDYEALLKYGHTPEFAKDVCLISIPNSGWSQQDQKWAKSQIERARLKACQPATEGDKADDTKTPHPTIWLDGWNAYFAGAPWGGLHPFGFTLGWLDAARFTAMSQGIGPTNPLDNSA
jgi:hypothetical protein